MENKRRQTGKKNRSSGALWEQIIESACRMYRDHGQAVIMKTPEPMRPIGKADAYGRFMACFTKKAQPDFQGTLRGGKSIVFEAKFTDSYRIYRKVVSEAQTDALDAHYGMGAECDVLVSFKFKYFFMIPWSDFRDMKYHYGRLYLEPDDIPNYEVSIRDGKLHFLDRRETSETEGSIN